MRDLKAEKIREMNEDEILTKIGELKEEIFNLRFRNMVRQATNRLLAPHVHGARCRSDEAFCGDERDRPASRCRAGGDGRPRNAVPLAQRDDQLVAEHIP